MKNVSSLKSTKHESPKTPGGISKSLLTPCRRIGLSRNWKKAGPSPFISPISGINSGSLEVKVEKKETKKRKNRVDSDEIEEKVEITGNDENADDVTESKSDDLTCTPTRHVEVPRKKRSKTLLSAISNNTKIQENEPLIEKEASDDKLIKNNSEDNLNVEDGERDTNNVTLPVKRSKSKTKKSISPKSSKESLEPTSTDIKTKVNIEKEQTNVQLLNEEPKPRSPNELTKECIVVIQKKIFKTDKKDKLRKEKKPRENLTSQVLFDSDNDDVPLCQLNKETAVEISKTENKDSHNQEIIDLEDDFIETKRSKVKKLTDKATSIGGLKKKTPKLNTNKKNPAVIPLTPLTFNSEFDEDDDFDFNNKKTILIRKTYEKVNKPQRAKSTGSITQKDIDDLRARIQLKKKLLLARAMTDDTEELRSLIKKWQKGCQDALMELMDLMKSKFPDKQNTDYSEMLSMLKIPAQLVGYDEENDCFTTPDDTSIILSKFQDL